MNLTTYGWTLSYCTMLFSAHSYDNYMLGNAAQQTLPGIRNGNVCQTSHRPPWRCAAKPWWRWSQLWCRLRTPLALPLSFRPGVMEDPLSYETVLVGNRSKVPCEYSLSRE